MEIISIWNGKYEPSKRFCTIKDRVSRTIQDAIVDIPSLLKEFNGHLDDLFNKFNNGLVFESISGVGIFIDELNSDEVARYNKFLADKAAKELAVKQEAELFEQFKAEVGKRASEARQQDFENPVTPQTTYSSE